MKKSLILTVAGSLAIAILGSTAYADTSLDKGALGKYERQGRFLKPVLTSAPRVQGVDPQASVRTDGNLIVDKGDLGKYERQGRFLRPVLEVGPQGWAVAESASPAGGVVHEHGLNGKEHKNIGRKRAH